MRKGLASILLTGLSFASSTVYATFLPPNNLHLEDTILRSNVTEQEFNEAIDRAEEIYAPLIKSVHGTNLKINRLWTNSTVNASAMQYWGTWEVNMYGGLARRPEVTIDGFTLVLCHELGHHLAGYPFSSSWAANEGQSDYFATLSCARQLWVNDLERNASFRSTIESLPKDLCDSVWETEEAQNLCYRSMAAGKSLADLLSALRDDSVDFSTPDTTIVRQTVDSHPAGQCRLDTYMAGALCPAEFDESVIPAKKLGYRRNSREAESASAQYTCNQYQNFEVGTRPLCWFKPLL